MRATKANLLQYLKEIKPQLQQRGIAKLGLFGSYARGDESVYSDIDIAIGKSSDFLHQKNAYDYFEEIAELRKMIRQQFHRTIDIFDLDSDSGFKKSIVKDLIYV